MAHPDGIRVVRYRNFEEICSNVRAYHGYQPTVWELTKIRRIAGTEIRIAFAGDASDHPDLIHADACGLPVFRAIDLPGDAYVCAHLCEID